MLPGAAVAVTSEVCASTVLLLVVGSEVILRYTSCLFKRNVRFESKRLQVYTDGCKVC